jgi:hypothetical protein
MRIKIEKISSSLFTLITIPVFGERYAPANVQTDLVQAVMNITNYILGVVAMIAVLMIIYSGLMYLTSGGNDERIEAARKTFSNAIIGMVIVGLAYAIAIIVVFVISAEG